MGLGWVFVSMNGKSVDFVSSIGTLGFDVILFFILESYTKFDGLQHV